MLIGLLVNPCTKKKRTAKQNLSLQLTYSRFLAIYFVNRDQENMKDISVTCLPPKARSTKIVFSSRYANLSEARVTYFYF